MKNKRRNPLLPTIAINANCVEPERKWVCKDTDGYHGFGPTPCCAYATWEARRKLVRKLVPAGVG